MPLVCQSPPTALQRPTKGVVSSGDDELLKEQDVIVQLVVRSLGSGFKSCLSLNTFTVIISCVILGMLFKLSRLAKIEAKML